MPIIDSPLRYPGGKTQLSQLTADIAHANELHKGVYAEPFAGGAGIAWKLLLSGEMSEVRINDIDPGIFAFWNAVAFNPDPLCEKILKTSVTIDEWYKQRTILNSVSSTEEDLAFAVFFMNRTNRSGILKGGVIGGKEQDGKYKLDCRYNKDDLIRKIQRIHIYKKAIQVTRLDAKDCLQNWSKNLPKRSLINIDPPYFCKGQDLYINFYKESDHKELANVVCSLHLPWMLTYDDAPEIEKIYSGMPCYRKGLTYYAQVKRRASELLFLSPSLTLPKSFSLQNPEFQNHNIDSLSSVLKV